MSHETIYKRLFIQAIGALKKFLDAFIFVTISSDVMSLFSQDAAT